MRGDDVQEAKSEARALAGAQRGFFAVDRRVFTAVVDLGRNAAIAYLIVARGTGRDNMTSSWSMHAIEQRTSIARSRGKTAIATLLNEGLLRQTGTGARPKYELLPWAEVASRFREPLSAFEQQAFDLVNLGKALPHGHLVNAATRAAAKGRLRSLGNDQFGLPEQESDRHLVWLPNTLVDGAMGETSPLERLRQNGDSKAIQLLVDLYDSQNLREDGDISRSVVFQLWDRLELGSFGEFTIWGFMPSRQTSARATEIVKAQWDADAKSPEGRYAPFWRRLVILQDCGLIEWVPCLFERGDEDGEIIHTLLLSGDGGPEDRLARAAQQAGSALLIAAHKSHALGKGVELLVPVKRHISGVQIINIARLRYRPHTKRTSAWWAELNSACEAHIYEYESLTARAQGGRDPCTRADIAV